MEQTFLFANPKLQCTVWLSRGKVCIKPLSGARRHTILEVERRAGDRFSVGHPATCPACHWHQTYLRANWVPNWLRESWRIWQNCEWHIQHGYRIPGEISRYPKWGATSSYVLEPRSKGKIAQGNHICLPTVKNGEFCNPVSWHSIKRALLMKLLHMYWRENICTKNSLLLYVGDIRRNA